MSDMMQKGFDWLNEKRHQYMTKTVTYKRGTDSVELQATIGKSEAEAKDEYGGIRGEITSRDYLIRVEDLILGGVPTTPVAGDRIEETDGNKTYVYEVMALGIRPSFEYSDPYHKLFRIHTKEISA